MGNRYKNLDGLRAFAILLVLFFHASERWSDSVGWIKSFFKTGWNGVYLFFVLSGFLVGSLAIKELQKTSTINIKHFWARRFFRTWPLYFFLLAVNVILADRWDFTPSLWNYLTFTQNFYPLDFFTPTWSLAVEEQFYFFLPLILFLGRSIFLKNLFSSMNSLCIFLIFICYVYRWTQGTSSDTLAVTDSIVVGVLIANIRFHRPDFFEKLASYSSFLFFAGLGFVYTLFFFEKNEVRDVFLFGFQGIGFGLMVIAALDKRFFLAPLFSHRSLYLIALISYSVYLTHDRPIFWSFKIAEYLKVKLELGLWSSFFVFNSLLLVGSLVLGAAFYLTLEKLGLKLRDRWFPK